MRYRFMVFALYAAVLLFTHSVVLWAAEVDSDPNPSTASIKRGQELYQASCVVCHGTGAMGSVGPKLAGNPILSNDEAFWKVVHEGRHIMPPFKDMVTDRQLTDIRAWLRTLP